MCALVAGACCRLEERLLFMLHDLDFDQLYGGASWSGGGYEAMELSKQNPKNALQSALFQVGRLLQTLTTLKNHPNTTQKKTKKPPKNSKKTTKKTTKKLANRHQPWEWSG